MTTLATAEWGELAVQEVERRQRELAKRKEEVKKQLLKRVADGDMVAVELLARIKKMGG